MRGLAMAIAVTLAGAATANAQDSGRVGLTFGYPASVGMIWHISERLALRPEIAWTQISNTSTSVITTTLPNGVTLSTTSDSTSDQWLFGVGASAQLYVSQWEALHTYVSPRFLYSHGTGTSTFTSNLPAGIPSTFSSSEFTQNTYLVSGSFGAQYALGTRFGLYGEVGVAYTYSTSKSTQPGAGDSTGRTWSTRSGAGAIFYF